MPTVGDAFDRLMIGSGVAVVVGEHRFVVDDEGR